MLRNYPNPDNLKSESDPMNPADKIIKDVSELKIKKKASKKADQKQQSETCDVNENAQKEIVNFGDCTRSIT